MSHVDEGTLHAYLDGELPPVERERVDAHLRACPACQGRLEEERALIERSSRLLDLAVPPERRMLPLDELRQPRLTWRLRRPLAWAATIVLAVGIGWYARGSMEPRTLADRVQLRDETPTPAPAAVATGTPLSLDSSSQGQSGGRTAELKRAPVPEAALQSTNGIVSRQPAVDELDRRKSLPAAQVATGVGASDAPSPSAESRPAAAPPVMASRIARDAEPVGKLSSTWPLIERQPARDLLGTEPVAIPGFGIRAYRRNPVAATPEIVVEQVLDSGTVISLIERRLSAARADDAATGDRGALALAKEVNERLARFVGSLRVEIAGPLSPDSLSRLLELVR